MAAKVLKEQLRCTICFGIYTDPKILHCLHVYCRQCLVPLVAQDEEGQPGIACPTCRQITPIPVAELPSALRINRLLEIQEELTLIDYPYLAPVDASVSCLFSHHQVKEEDANKQVTDKHLDEISRTCCRKWKSLRPHLEIEEIVEHNIVRGPGDEEEKRRSFFFQWKNVMGSAATYNVLICALFKIKCREDAECVCKLLAQSQGSRETGEGVWPAMLSSGMSIS